MIKIIKAVIKGWLKGVEKGLIEQRNCLGFLNFLIPAAMGIGGAIKGGLSASSANSEAAKRNRARAMGIKFSPWTGYKAGEKAEGASTLGGVMGGGMTGVQAGMGLAEGIGKMGISGSGGGFNMPSGLTSPYSLGANIQLQGMDINTLWELKKAGLI